jgi:hypothetical protein
MVRTVIPLKLHWWSFGITFLFLIQMSGCARLPYLEAFGGYCHKPRFVERQLCPCNAQGQIESCTKTLMEFDRRGRQISMQNFKKDGTPSGGKWLYEYDRKGNLIVLTIYDAAGKPQTTNTYTYNEKGRKLSWEFDGFGKKSKADYTYDDAGNMIWVNSRYEDGSFKERTRFTYDDQGRKTAMLVYNAKDTLTTHVEYSYDDRGFLVQNKWHNIQRENITVRKFVNNEHGDRTLQQTFELVGDSLVLKSESKTSYQYDQWGNCIEDILHKGEIPSWITKTRFVYW